MRSKFRKEPRYYGQGDYGKFLLQQRREWLLIEQMKRK